MEVIRKINNELAIAGYVCDEQLQQLREEGFKAVLYLRASEDEQPQMIFLGIYSVNLLINSEVMSPEMAAKVLQKIDELPKPILISCNNAMIAAAMALMSIAMRQGNTLQQAFQRAEELGLFAVLV